MAEPGVLATLRASLGQPLVPASVPKVAAGVDFGGLWFPLGSLWALLGTSWGLLGASGTPLGAPWRPSGPFLGPSGAQGGLKLGQISILGPLEAHVTPRGPFCDPFWTPLAHFGWFLVNFVSLLGLLLG